ncbi:glycerophosphodiester phosphodiesterase family protein [Francisella sp. SYW-9]|uniref:glycerophosphodiester phosphodiesterase family protein n=1 Tax=Francisella sp. SYW-9 TaxID=2610888 RepID=UPI00123CDCB5|nr:glycerophosphodiester phosphodiesterase family protein [Francisella sp. SYW-9]
MILKNFKQIFLTVIFCGGLFNFIIIYASDIPKNSNPIIIAHHAGGGDWPENTIYAIKKSQKYTNYINLTLMLSKDDVPFLFHGFDLAKTTNGVGNPENKTIEELKRLDAGYEFKKNNKFIYRNKGIKIPTLNEALKIRDKNTIFILDIKTNKYKKLIHIIIHSFTKKDWEKTIFYSTNSKALKYLQNLHPTAQVFQNRNLTRKTLLQLYLKQNIPEDKLNSDHTNWMAFENKRNMEVCEEFTLGKSCTNIIFNNLWNRETVKKIKESNPSIKSVMIGVNTISEYNYAQSIGMFGIYTDYPILISSND